MRSFVMILPCLTQSHNMAQGSTLDQAVHILAKSCAQMYASLEAGDAQALARRGKRFQSQYMALALWNKENDPTNEKAWRLKPNSIP